MRPRMSRLARRAAACALVAAAVGLPRAEALIPAETSTTTTLPPIPAVTTTTSTTTIPQIVSATPVPTLAPPTVTEVTTVPGSSLPVGSSSPGPSTIPALTTGPEIPTSLVSTIPTEAPTSLYYSKGISDPLFVPGVDPTTDASFDDALPEEVPFTGAVASTYGAPFTGTSFAAELAKLTAGERQRALDIQARLATATARVEEAKKSLSDLTSSGRQSRDDLARLNSLRDKLAVSMRQRALRQYTGESARYLRLILEAKDLNVLRRRTDLISQAQRRDAALVQSYRQSAKSLEVEEAKFNAIREARQFEIDQLADEEAKLKKDFDELTALLGALQAPLAFEGFVFPVQPPYAYTDTYGADRMNGTQFEHKHQGVDIFAREGTPVIATKRGVVYSIGVARLGGNRLWLKDVDGTCYYYAHLVAFASGLYENKIVESGEVLGFVGTTGNAVGTPPHLHYEIHPQCEGPTNPTPILNAVENANLEQYVAAVRPVFGGGALPSGSSPSTTPAVTVPGAGTTSLPVTIPGAGAPPLVGNAPGGSTKVVPTSGVVRRATSVPLPVPSVRKLTVPPPTTARNSTSVPDGTGSIRTSTTIR
jgi:murein DD-endopeptidase MepM/ murein hydrolase activator NlpD